MARTTPQVNKGILTIRSGTGERHLTVGSAEWWHYLADETMTTFRFIGQQGSFTARRERKGGGTYWYAYRKLQGKLHKSYLGKDEDLLVPQMETVAQRLARPMEQISSTLHLPEPVVPGQFNGLDEEPVHRPAQINQVHHRKSLSQDIQPPLSGTLLATKLFLPQLRPDLVARSRLLKRLDTGLRRKLTVVIAPAGFGKTTLLSSWMATLDHAHSDAACVAWLSLDEADNDPVRFWAYIIAALKSCYLPIGNQVGPLLSLLAEPSSQPQAGEGRADDRALVASPVETLVTPLINILVALPHPVVLALDDYHLITSQPIHEGITFLLEHLPPRLHLVIASRREPPLPLSRLRAQGQLNELGASDLRFTLQEVTVFLNQVIGLSLTHDEIAKLDAHTEGWIAALQLVALSMQGEEDTASIISHFAGSHRYIMDYLTDEVLQRQPAYIRDFLLQTSILDRLGEALCNAVTGREDSQAILEYLEQGNLFLMRLDEQRRWYHYHPLFAEFLQARLQQTYSEQVPELHLRASVWCEQNGYITGAVNHAFAADDMRQAAITIEHFAQVMLMRGEITTFLQWANMLPRAVLFTRPMLCIYVAGAYCSIGYLDTAEEFLPIAEHALEALKQKPADERQHAAIQQLEGELLTVRVALVAYLGDLPGTIELTQRAYAALPTENIFMRSVLITALGSAYLLSGDLWRASEVFEEAIHASLEAHNLHAALASMGAQAFLQMGFGRLRQAERTHRRVIQLSIGPGGRRFAVASMSYALLGELLAEWNELDKAERYIADGIELGKKWGYVGMIGESYTALSYIHLAHGDYDKALLLAREAEQQVRSYNMPLFTTLAAAFHAFAQLRAGDLEAAVQWANSCGLSAYDIFTYPREREHLFLVQVRMAQGQFEQAQRILERLLPVAEEGGRMHTVIDCFILQALLLHIQGQEHQALAALTRALALAEPEGYIRIFIDKADLDRYLLRQEDAEGPLLLLLRRAAARGVSLPYVRKLLAALGEPAPDTITQPAGLLSERELMILQAIAAGKSNGEIARELVVALSTVKTHLYNIYARLGVHSRTQAIARARVLHLIP